MQYVSTDGSARGMFDHKSLRVRPAAVLSRYSRRGRRTVVRIR